MNGAQVSGILISYRTPAERMASIRRMRKKRGKEAAADVRYATWKAGSILNIADPYNLPAFGHADRTHLRRQIARRDWQERIKRKRRVGLKTRRIVIALSGGECTYCCRRVRDRDFEIDHIVPVTRGGRSNLANLAAACHRCNKNKGDMLVSEWIDAQMRFAAALAAEIIADCEATGTPLEEVWPLNRYAPRPAQPLGQMS